MSQWVILTNPSALLCLHFFSYNIFRHVNILWSSAEIFSVYIVSVLLRFLIMSTYSGRPQIFLTLYILWTSGAHYFLPLVNILRSLAEIKYVYNSVFLTLATMSTYSGRPRIFLALYILCAFRALNIFQHFPSFQQTRE